MAEHNLQIHPYAAAGENVVELRPYDPRAATVAQDVGRRISQRLGPAVTVEHVGSTAIPGCDGKGVVDIMVVCPRGTVSTHAASLLELGLQRQSGGHQHGEDRPMREGAVHLDNTWFRLHVHVVEDGSDPVRAFRVFRDQLRADPELLRRYVEHKRQLVEGGVKERAAYSGAKAQFIQDVLRRGQP